MAEDWAASNKIFTFSIEPKLFINGYTFRTKMTLLILDLCFWTTKNLSVSFDYVAKLFPSKVSRYYSWAAKSFGQVYFNYQLTFL